MSEPATTFKPEAAPLRAVGVDIGYGGSPIVAGLDLEIPASSVTAVIGPNGCGKSTTLRALARLLRPSAGHVELHGRPLSGMRPREVARRLAMLPQTPQAPQGMTVADLAARGRQPHQPWYRQWSAEDDRIAEQALADTGVLDLADRPLEELSGGQRQRAWIAMTLAQQTPILLLDEPTSHLDLAHGVEVLELLVRLRRDTGRTIVVVLHDLSLAARYADHLVVMRDGAIVARGPPATTMTSGLLMEAFGLRAHVFADPIDHAVTVVPAIREADAPAAPASSDGVPVRA